MLILLSLLPALALGLPTTQDGDQLMTVTSTRSTAVCCSDRSLKSCAGVAVRPEILGTGKLQLPRGEAFTFMNNIKDPNAYYYKSENGDDMVIVHNPRTGGLNGHANLASSGESFVLENCVNEGHVWKEQDVTKFVEEVHVQDKEERSINPTFAALIDQGKNSKASASYSVKFYYTPAFAAETPDIEGYTDLAIAESNQGYINSRIDNTVYRLCIEAATIEEIEDSSDFLHAFKYMKGSTTELRDTADQTTLLAMDFSSCGVGYVNTISNGLTLTVVQKKCGVGYFSFGHEIGHNYGCAHNPEQSHNSYYPYGHGHLIERGSASTGYRTVLAYTASGHSTRVNYYSNPEILYSVTDTPTGLEGLSNNARLIQENRFGMQEVGDESGCRTLL